MKKTLFFAAIAAILSQSAIAEGSKGDELSRHKEKMLSDLRARSSLINSKISCVQSASTTEALKACHEKARSEEEAFHEKRRSEEKSEMMAHEEKRRAEFDKRMREMEEKRSAEKSKQPQR